MVLDFWSSSNTAFPSRRNTRRVSRSPATVEGPYAIWRPRVGLPRFDVDVHWFWRFEHEPGNRWLREKIVTLFGEG